MVGPPLDPGGNRALARWRTLAVAATVAALLLAVALAWQIARPAVGSPGHAHSLASVHSRGTPGFHDPVPIADDGIHVWVANEGGGARDFPSSVTELNARDGSWVLTVSGGMSADPVAIYALGGDIWVANRYGGRDRGSVAEPDTSDGRWVRSLSGGSYRFNYPVAMTADNTDVWVVNGGSGGRDGSVTELAASDGHWVRTLSGVSYGFDYPSAIAADGTHVWVTNVGNDSVTELNASDGSWVQTLHW
jgi:DNA-binding beta-propeller fold protein YncE